MKPWHFGKAIRIPKLHISYFPSSLYSI